MIITLQTPTTTIVIAIETHPKIIIISGIAIGMSNIPKAIPPALLLLGYPSRYATIML